MKNLNSYSQKMDKLLKEAKDLIKENPIKAQTAVFDIRGKLYELAFEVAPDARQNDIDAMKEWIKPKIGETSIDIAAGTGFLTKSLAEWTKNTVYAVDPSKEQLSILKKNIKSPFIKTVVGSLAQETKDERVGILNQIKEQVDFITSFGGIHHVYYQKKMMEHAEKLLKSGGRFVAADVGNNTALSKHFDEIVTKKCITSHTAYWLSEKKLKELISDFPSLSLSKTEMKIQRWVFNSRREMALFFKGLHAYDLPDDEIVKDLHDYLGFKEENGKIILNWPMLFFEIVKK